MSEINEAKTKPSTEKTNVAAADAAPVVEQSEVPTVLEIPAKPKRAAVAKAALAKSAPAKAKPRVTSKVAKSGKAVKSLKANPRTATPKPKAAARKPVASQPSLNSSLKEKIMPKNAKIAKNIQTVVTDGQAKARKAVEKGSSLLGECGEFTKGNVEAVVESGKVLANGLQSMGKELVAEGRTSFEMVTGEVKQLAAVRSPSEFVKVQGDIARKNLDTAIALGSKNSGTMLKLASEIFAPISGRFSLAAEKVRKAAA
jgi:hypothetical protein